MRSSSSTLVMVCSAVPLPLMVCPLSSEIPCGSVARRPMVRHARCQKKGRRALGTAPRNLASQSVPTGILLALVLRDRTRLFPRGDRACLVVVHLVIHAGAVGLHDGLGDLGVRIIHQAP